MIQRWLLQRIIYIIHCILSTRQVDPVVHQAHAGFVLPCLLYTSTSGKYGTLKQSYHEFYRIYGTLTREKDIKPELIITEDSNSGYQFFDYVCRENHLRCETMNGKSNVFHYLRDHKNEKILVIADGAAFGSETSTISSAVVLSSAG